MIIEISNASATFIIVMVRISKCCKTSEQWIFVIIPFRGTPAVNCSCTQQVSCSSSDTHLIARYWFRGNYSAGYVRSLHLSLYASSRTGL
jgi:hypothetical protein